MLCRTRPARLKGHVDYTDPNSRYLLCKFLVYMIIINSLFVVSSINQNLFLDLSPETSFSPPLRCFLRLHGRLKHIANNTGEDMTL